MHRCAWAGSDPLMIAYHDEEWGVPVHDDRKLFEFLVLDTFQAGLSWRTILNKRENFRAAFDGFEAERIARYGEVERQRLLADVCQLMKFGGRDEDHLPAMDDLPLLAETHLARAVEDEVDLILLLIVPGHLAASGLQHHVAEAEVLGPNRRGAAYQVAGTPLRREGAAFHFAQIHDLHTLLLDDFVENTGAYCVLRTAYCVRVPFQKIRNTQHAVRIPHQ